MCLNCCLRTNVASELWQTDLVCLQGSFTPSSIIVRRPGPASDCPCSLCLQTSRLRKRAGHAGWPDTASALARVVGRPQRRASRSDGAQRCDATAAATTTLCAFAAAPMLELTIHAAIAPRYLDSLSGCHNLRHYISGFNLSLSYLSHVQCTCLDFCCPHPDTVPPQVFTSGFLSSHF